MKIRAELHLGTGREGEITNVSPRTPQAELAKRANFHQRAKRAAGLPKQLTRPAVVEAGS